MSSYIFFSFLAAILFAGAILVSKFLTKHKIKNPNSFFALTLLMLLPNLLVMPLISNVFITSQAIFPLIIYSVLFTVGVLFFSHGIYKIDASVVGPLFQLQAGLVVILAAIFLKEKYPLLTYLWVSFLIIGAVLVTINERMKLTFFFQKGVMLIIIMQVLHAASNIMVGFTLRHINSFSLVFFGYLINALLAVFLVMIKKPKLNYPPKILGLMFLRGSFQFYGATSLFFAFKENVSISSAIGLLNAPIVFIVAILASKFYPKLLEHHSAKVYAIRALGLLIILTGAIKLALK